MLTLGTGLLIHPRLGLGLRSAPTDGEVLHALGEMNRKINSSPLTDKCLTTLTDMSNYWCNKFCWTLTFSNQRRKHRLIIHTWHVVCNSPCSRRRLSPLCKRVDRFLWRLLTADADELHSITRSYNRCINGADCVLSNNNPSWVTLQVRIAIVKLFKLNYMNNVKTGNTPTSTEFRL